MAPAKNKLKQTDREEDYRDYEERDLKEGWPYADEDRMPAERNIPYGKSPSNFDESQNIGAEISDTTGIKTVGDPPLTPSAEDEFIADDVLEEKITGVLEDDKAIDTALVTVTVNNGMATLSGRTDTQGSASHAQTLVKAVKGVRECRSDLVVVGVDGHIPRDVNE